MSSKGVQHCCSVSFLQCNPKIGPQCEKCMTVRVIRYYCKSPYHAISKFGSLEISSVLDEYQTHVSFWKRWSRQWFPQYASSSRIPNSLETFSYLQSYLVRPSRRLWLIKSYLNYRVSPTWMVLRRKSQS